jgi:two-component system alkaline phosphatase synthesis response regulator PhoP
MRKILLVESDPDYRDALSTYLRDFFSVQITHTPEAAWRAVQSWLPDIIILDEPSALRDSIDLIRNLRNDDQLRQTGIIVLCEAEQSPCEEELYLRGADVVLARSIRPNALILRLSALLQRIEGFQNLQDAKLNLGDVTIHPVSKTVECAGRIISLTPTQYSILLAFACHPNQVLTRKWMQQNIWRGTRVSPRSIDAQISKLKKVLPSLHERIVNVYGEGYLLMPQKKAA